MIDIAIVEKDESIREQIINLIGKQRSDCRIISMAGEELLRAKQSFHIIFMENGLAEKKNRKTARTLRKRQKDMVLVFLTGKKESDDDMAAVHYLWKPVEEKAFGEVFERAVLEAERRKILGRGFRYK